MGSVGCRGISGTRHAVGSGMHQLSKTSAALARRVSVFSNGSKLEKILNPELPGDSRLRTENEASTVGAGLKGKEPRHNGTGFGPTVS